MPSIPSPIEGLCHPTARNYPAFLKFLSLSYGFKDPRWFERDAPFFFGPKRSQLGSKYALTLDGHFAAHVGLFPFHALVEGHSLRVAGIGAVATHPHYRSQGLMKRLMDQVAGVVENEGYGLSILWGERDLYRPYGYERGLFLDQFSFRKRPMAYFAAPGKVRPARPEDFPVIRKLYAAHSFRIQKDLSQTFSNLRRFDRPSESPLWVLEEKGKAVAYSAFWRPVPFWKKGPGPLDVAEWGGSTEDVVCLWASILQRDKGNTLTATLYPGCGLFDWALENCSNQTRTSQSCMLKVLDLYSVLKAFEPQLRRRYEAFGVRVDKTLWFQPDGGKAVGLECGRRLKVVTRSKKGGIPLSAQGMVRMLFGAGRPSSSVKVLEGERFLDGLFPLDWYWWRSEWI